MKKDLLNEDVEKNYKNLVSNAQQLASILNSLLAMKNLSEQDKQIIFRVLGSIDFIIRCIVYEAILLRIILIIESSYIVEYCKRRIEFINLETKPKLEGYNDLIIMEVIQATDAELKSQLDNSCNIIKKSSNLLDRNIEIYQAFEETEYIEWKVQDFLDQDWKDYFVVAMDEQLRVFFAAKEVGPDLTAAIVESIKTIPNALDIVDEVIEALNAAKEVATEGS